MRPVTTAMYIVVSSICFSLAALMITFCLRLVSMQGIDALSILLFIIAIVMAVLGVFCVIGVKKERKNHPGEKLPGLAKGAIVLSVLLTVIVIVVILVLVMLFINPLNMLYFM